MNIPYIRIKKEQVQPDLLGSYLLYRCIDHHFILRTPGYDLPALPLLRPAFCHPFKQCFLADLDPVPTPECREAFLMHKLIRCRPGYTQDFLHFLHIQHKGKIVIVCRSVTFHRHGPPSLKIFVSSCGQPPVWLTSVFHRPMDTRYVGRSIIIIKRRLRISVLPFRHQQRYLSLPTLAWKSQAGFLTLTI